MIPSPRVSPIPLLAWAAAVLLAAAPISMTPARAAGEVNVYSSRHYKADRDLYRRFSAKTGIRVNLVQGKANALFERLKREGRNSPADLLITVDAGNLARAQAAKLFQPVRSALIDAAVPAAHRSGEVLKPAASDG